MTIGTDGSGGYTPYPFAQEPRRELPPPSTTTASWAIGLALVPIPLAMIVAFVLAVIVLNRCGDGRNHGRKRAIAAIVLVCVWVLGYVALAVAYSAGEADRDTDGTVATAGRVPVNDLVTGDCLPDGSFDEGRATTVEVVPCDELHGAEVYADFDLEGDDFPGEDQVTRLAEGGCLDRLENLAGASWEELPYEMYYFYPQEQDWSYGTTVACVAVLPEQQRGLLEDNVSDDLADEDSSSA